jgi:hypothetical protein
MALPQRTVRIARAGVSVKRRMRSSADEPGMGAMNGAAPWGYRHQLQGQSPSARNQRTRAQIGLARPWPTQDSIRWSEAAVSPCHERVAMDRCSVAAALRRRAAVRRLPAVRSRRRTGYCRPRTDGGQRRQWRQLHSRDRVGSSVKAPTRPRGQFAGAFPIDLFEPETRALGGCDRSDVVERCEPPSSESRAPNSEHFR